MNQDNEIVLKGGRTTPEVVKIANRVHRLQKNNSPFVHELLSDLTQVDFTGAPHFLGIDAKN